MEETKHDELLDAYLKNKLSEDDRQKLYRMMKSDEGMRQLVFESRKTYAFLQFLRYKQIKENLRAYDRNINDSPEKKTFKPQALRLAFLFLLIVIAAFSIRHHYSPVSIAKRNFINIISGGDAIDSISESAIIHLRVANDLFKMGEYQRAEVLFNHLGNDAYYTNRHIASWNTLICRLAMYGPTDDIRKELSAFHLSSDEQIRRKSEVLARILSSRFYSWIITTQVPELSVWKPRLM